MVSEINLFQERIILLIHILPHLPIMFQDLLFYRRTFGNNFILICFLKRSSSSFSHKPPVFEVHTTILIQLSPMASFPPWRNPLRQPAVRQLLQRQINPSKAQRLFDHLKVGDTWISRYFRARSDYPARPFGAVVVFEPFAEVGARSEFKQEIDFHS